MSKEVLKVRAIRLKDETVERLRRLASQVNWEWSELARSVLEKYTARNGKKAG